MTRRITALLLALLLALSLTACGNPAQTMDTIEKTAQTVQQIAEVLNDAEEDTESAALPASEAQEAAEEASEEPAQASDQETAAEEPAEAAAETPAIDEDGVYTTKDDVALYLHTYGHLPSNFITKKEAEKLGVLHDCLTDLSDPVHLTVLHAQALEDALGAYCRSFQRVLSDSAQENGHFTLTWEE